MILNAFCNYFKYTNKIKQDVLEKFICIYIYIYIYIHINIHTHIHTHIYINSKGIRVKGSFLLAQCLKPYLIPPNLVGQSVPSDLKHSLYPILVYFLLS